MRIKVYVVEPKRRIMGADTYYYVDAPSKRIAKWCGSALYNHKYATLLSAKDIKATRFKINKD